MTSALPRAASPLRPGWGTLFAAAVLAGLTVSLPAALQVFERAPPDAVALRPAPAVVPAPRSEPPPAPPPRERRARANERPKPAPPLAAAAAPKRPVRPLDVRLALPVPSLLPTAGGIPLDLGSEGASSGLPGVEEPLLAFGVADLDVPPAALVRVDPVYPEEARRKGIEGSVVLRFTITPEGRVEDPSAVRADPGDVFVPAALEAVRRWRFAPPKKSGEPVSVRAEQTIYFRLR